MQLGIELQLGVHVELFKKDRELHIVQVEVEIQVRQFKGQD